MPSPTPDDVTIEEPTTEEPTTDEPQSDEPSEPHVPTPDETVYSILSQSGIPGTKYAWPVGDAPPLPWFVYKRAKHGEFFADDSTYSKLRRYSVDLYQRELDDDVRDAFEERLAEVGPFSSYETWIPHERCWVTSYSTTLRQ